MDWAQISTVVTAVATVTYVIFTLRIVRETIALRRVQTEPNIVLLIKPEEKFPNLYDIIVKNTGTAAAYNLKWHYDKNAELAEKENVGINRFEFFKSVKYFAPGQEFHSLLGSGVDLLGKPFLPALDLTLEYENEGREKATKKFVLDPALLYGHSWIGDQHDMAESLYNIQREVSRLSSGFRRIKIDVYDKGDREREKQEHEKVDNVATHENIAKKIKKRK